MDKDTVWSSTPSSSSLNSHSSSSFCLSPALSVLSPCAFTHGSVQHQYCCRKQLGLEQCLWFAFNLSSALEHHLRLEMRPLHKWQSLNALFYLHYLSPSEAREWGRSSLIPSSCTQTEGWAHQVWRWRHSIQRAAVIKHCIPREEICSIWSAVNVPPRAWSRTFVLAPDFLVCLRCLQEECTVWTCMGLVLLSHFTFTEVQKNPVTTNKSWPLT